MAYSSTQREARYKIAKDQRGNIITKWFRKVVIGEDGTPDVVTFEGYCAEDAGDPRCDLSWAPAVSTGGKLIEKYSCSSVSCDGPEGCILQYSLDDEEWFDVTEDQQPLETQDCYFRCGCSGS